MLDVAEVSFSDESMACKYLMKSAAHRLKQNEYGTEHLLIGLLHYEDERAARILLNRGITMSTVLDIVRKKSKPSANPVHITKMIPKTTLGSVFTEATRKAESSGDRSIEPLHLLWGLLLTSACQATLILEDLEVNIAILRAEIEQAFIDGIVVLKGPYAEIKKALGDPTMSDYLALGQTLILIEEAKRKT